MMAARDWSQYADLHIAIFADCIPVKGIRNSAFYDLGRNEIVSFPSEYFFLLEEIHGSRVGSFLEKAKEGPSEIQILTFLEFLDENEFVFLTNDVSAFPRIKEGWEFPGAVHNAVIDVSTHIHDFKKIFAELSVLGCQYIEVRGFSNVLSLHSCETVLNLARNLSIISVALIIKYDDSVLDFDYRSFVIRHPLVTSMIVHSAPVDRRVSVDELSIQELDGAPNREVRFSTEVLNSEIDCGKINQRLLTLPTVETVFEAKRYNGCLNRKLSIDQHGEIKNCPSMKDSFGSIRNTSLLMWFKSQNSGGSGNFPKIK